MSDKDFKVVKISSSVRNEAEKVHTKAFMKSWEDGVPIQLQVQERLKSSGIYDSEALDEKALVLRKTLKELEVSLRKAKNPDGSKMSKLQGRDIALKMMDTRQEISNVTEGINKYFNHTAESVAMLERISFLVFACTKKLDGSDYWPSFSDYKSDTGSKVADEAMTEVLKQSFGVDGDAEKKLYENSWLIKQGFMDAEGRFLNEAGKFVTRDGKLVDGEGNYVNEFGNRIDVFGNPIDKDGNLDIADEWVTEMEKPLPAVPTAFPSGVVVAVNNQ